MKCAIALMSCLVCLSCSSENGEQQARTRTQDFDRVDWQTQSRIDRVGRPLVNLLFIDALATAAGIDHDDMLDGFNAASPDVREAFVPPIMGTLALLDAVDGVCGNQLGASSAEAGRYVTFASILADDRLYVNRADRTCNGFFGLERSVLGGESSPCGGRVPTDHVVKTLYQAAVTGFVDESTIVSDGLDGQEVTFSDEIPLLRGAGE